MKRISVFMLVVFVLIACQDYTKEKSAVSINGIEFTAEEMAEVFKESPFYEADNNSAKQDFLGSFITKKLVLLEAEKSGLNKNKEFLKDVQRYWEMSLFKLTMSRKAKELAPQVDIKDKEIQEYYKENKNVYGDKEIAEVYDSIKWILLRKKQSEVLNDWLYGLRQKADIDIKYGLLGINE